MNNKINFKGLNPSVVTSFIITLIALVNIVLSVFGVNPIVVDNNILAETISAIFAFVMVIYSAHKNFNYTVGSQKLQVILDALNKGYIMMDDIDKLYDSIVSINEFEESIKNSIIMDVEDDV